MITLLNASAFNGQAIDEQMANRLIEQGNNLLKRAQQLAQQ